MKTDKPNAAAIKKLFSERAVDISKFGLLKGVVNAIPLNGYLKSFLLALDTKFEVWGAAEAHEYANSVWGGVVRHHAELETKEGEKYEQAYATLEADVETAKKIFDKLKLLTPSLFEKDGEFIQLCRDYESHYQYAPVSALLQHVLTLQN